MAPVATKRKAVQGINLTPLPAAPLCQITTRHDSSLRTRALLGPAQTETLISTNHRSRSRLTEKGIEYQLQVEADKQRLSRQRERRLACEEAARAQEALNAEITALRDEGLGDEEIEEFLDDPNTNDSGDEPEPQA